MRRRPERGGKGTGRQRLLRKNKQKNDRSEIKV